MIYIIAKVYFINVCFKRTTIDTIILKISKKSVVKKKNILHLTNKLNEIYPFLFKLSQNVIRKFHNEKQRVRSPHYVKVLLFDHLNYLLSSEEILSVSLIQ